VTNDDKPKSTGDDSNHRLEVVIDPPRLPVRIDKTLEIESVQSVNTQFQLGEEDSTGPLVETVEPADGTDQDCSVAVVCCVHGDEVCGREAAERFLSVRENLSVTEPVKFVLANPRATAQGQRWVDEDLNRVFEDTDDEQGGAESYERGLREDLQEELDGCDVLDLHSTDSTSEPFAVTSLFEPIDTQGSAQVDECSFEKHNRDDKQRRKELVNGTGIVSHAVEATQIGGGLVSYSELSGVAVECGKKGTERAADNAYRAIRNFLLNEGVITSTRGSPDSAGGVATEAAPEWHLIFDSVDKPEYDFVGNNFEPVEHGEVYAVDGERELEATQEFVPVLMSSSGEGYDDRLGYRARSDEV
jgi:predicted deacylase